MANWVLDLKKADKKWTFKNPFGADLSAGVGGEFEWTYHKDGKQGYACRSTRAFHLLGRQPGCFCGSHGVSLLGTDTRGTLRTSAAGIHSRRHRYTRA